MFSLLQPCKDLDEKFIHAKHWTCSFGRIFAFARKRFRFLELLPEPRVRPSLRVLQSVAQGVHQNDLMHLDMPKECFLHI